MLGIRRLNAFLGKNLKYILASTALIILAILTDAWIAKTTVQVSTVADFFKNTLIIILWIVPFSIVTSSVLKYINLLEVIKLNEFFKRYLLLFLIAGFILIGIILNIKYGKFTPETERFLRAYTVIDQALKIFGL